MTVPVVEVFSRLATAAFRENPNDRALVSPAYDILTNVDGQIKSYYGILHEDKATVYNIIAWESHQHHQNLMDDTETYKRLKDALSSMLDVSAPASMYHIIPSSEPYKAFEAPVLVIATFTLHSDDDKNKPALVALVNQLENAMNNAGEAAGVIHATAGQVLEKDNVLAILIGYTTVQAHLEMVHNDATIIDLIKKIKGIIASAEMIHVPLTLYRQPEGVL